MVESLERLLKDVLNQLGYTELSAKIIKSNRPDLCDYQYDGVFKLASLVHKNPVEIGEEIVNKINSIDEINEYFQKVEFVKPGFINLTLSNKFIMKNIELMNVNNKFNLKQPQNVETFVIDYGGYNIAKPLHIGHLRPTIIGESIKRIIEFCGHKTISDVHLGDYGLQMGQVIYGIKRDNIKIEEIDINYLNEIYPEISGICKENQEVKEECARITKELQDGVNEEYNIIWKKIIDVSLEDIKKLCDYFDVHFDLWEGESDSYKILEEVEKILEEKNILETSEGAKIVNVIKEDDKKPMPPLMFKKSNGAYVYDSTDLATIYDRKKRFNPDHIIYVTDFRQNLHFEQVFRASEKAGFIPCNKLEHAYNGTINGNDGKPFKTRNGQAPKLSELITLVKDTFLNLKEDNKNMSEEDVNIIVNSIIKFADLQNGRDKDYIFDVEKFSNVVGKTGPYILYTYVRINKILKSEEKDFTKLSNNIYNKQDRDLKVQLINLESAVSNAFNNRMPNYIATYLYDTCVALNAFYQQNHISSQENKDIKNDWLCILELSNRILKEMLSLLMIDIPSIM